MHVDDLAALVADLATGQVAGTADGTGGPVTGGCTAVNVAGEPATARDYVGTVTAALGLAAEWDDEQPAWTGQILTDRARSWGWAPAVPLATALAELRGGLDGTPAAS